MLRIRYLNIEEYSKVGPFLDFSDPPSTPGASEIWNVSLDGRQMVRWSFDSTSSRWVKNEVKEDEVSAPGTESSISKRIIVSGW
jgi:hypothetical protein